MPMPETVILIPPETGLLPKQVIADYCRRENIHSPLVEEIGARAGCRCFRISHGALLEKPA